ALAMMGEGVAGPPEDVRGRFRVGQLRLLHEQDVGPRAREPPRELLEARLQRVDVPGRDPHGPRLPRSGAEPTQSNIAWIASTTILVPTASLRTSPSTTHASYP